MDMGDGGNPGQVAAISSTASFKSPMSSMSTGEESMSEKVSICGDLCNLNYLKLIQNHK